MKARLAGLSGLANMASFLTLLWLGNFQVEAGTGAPVDFHGLLHFPLGQAVLTVVPSGSGEIHEHLVVSNIGDSGQDGVDIDLGIAADSWELTGSYDPRASGGEVRFAALEDAGTDPISLGTISPDTSGGLLVAADFSTSGASTQNVLAFLDQELVRRLQAHPDGVPAASFPDQPDRLKFVKVPDLDSPLLGQFKADPDGTGPLFPGAWELKFDQPVPVRFPDQVVVMANRLVITPEDPTGAGMSLRRMKLTAARVPQIIIFDEFVPNQQLDHFLSYQIAALPQFQPRVVDLSDQFETGSFRVTRPSRLYNPADKNDEGIIDPETHLVGYGLNLVPGQPPHVPVTDLTVINQFGSLMVDTIRPITLLVPSAKTLRPPLPPPPDPDAHRVDHFKCYEVRVTPGTPPFPPEMIVLVADQFEQPKRYEVLGPRSLCNPADKNGEGIKNPEAHLMCYGIQPVAGEPLHERVIGLTNNQFAPQLFITVQERELCLPSEKIVP